MSKGQADYDVIIVGSGAAGGMTAFILAVNGVKVLMLEAGRDYDPVTETPMFQLPSDAPLRGGGSPEKPFGYYEIRRGACRCHIVACHSLCFVFPQTF